ncbi:Nucleoporin nup84 [Elasticomyces elasticus]|nr:Nucleoporin nup84 [Elasticomyces elasticus]
MAPVRPQSANTKAIRRKQPNKNDQSDGWELVEVDGSHGELNSVDSVKDAMNPLAEVADRVGREVEMFAERLDTYITKRQSQDPQGAALQLVESFKTCAEENIKMLKKRHEAQRRRELKESWSKRMDNLSDPTANGTTVLAATEAPADDPRNMTTVQDLEQWQAEADTWDLFSIMLKLHYIPSQPKTQREKEVQLSALSIPHRYTPESEIWERFIVEDDLAKERLLILRWLEQTADHNKGDVEIIAAALESKAGRGKALWSHGWMDTKAKLKQEKRLRAWNGPVDPSQVQIKTSHSAELLVTALDPDASTRQEPRALERTDALFERSFWLVCWEMLRRGRSRTELCQWCSARNQQWRSISMGLIALDTAGPAGHAETASRSLWRHVCLVTARQGSGNNYEAAVYGLLSGEVQSVENISQSWDDHVYAHYSSLLLRQFDIYLQTHFPARFPSASDQILATMSADQHQGKPSAAGEDLVEKLKVQKNTKDLATQPMKLIQGSLIGKSLETLLGKLGFAIGETGRQSNEKTAELFAKPQTRRTTDPLTESPIEHDHNALRIATHMLLVLRDLNLQDTVLRAGKRWEIYENVIIGYVQWLRSAGKRDLIPLYVSQLDKKRAEMTLGWILPDVMEHSEQQEIVRLMASYGLDPVSVLEHQYSFVTEGSLVDNRDHGVDAIPPLNLLQHTKDPIYPGQCIDKAFMSQSLTEVEEKIIRSCQWFVLLEGQWDATFYCLASACKAFLRESMTPHYRST